MGKGHKNVGKGIDSIRSDKVEVEIANLAEYAALAAFTANLPEPVEVAPTVFPVGTFTVTVEETPTLPATFTDPYDLVADKSISGYFLTNPVTGKTEKRTASYRNANTVLDSSLLSGKYTRAELVEEVGKVSQESEKVGKHLNWSIPRYGIDTLPTGKLRYRNAIVVPIRK